MSSTSFLSGAASILELPGNYYRYNVSSTPEEADARALRCDFKVVGDQIRAQAAKVLYEQRANQLELQLH